jgi:hypothetical protein
MDSDPAELDLAVEDVPFGRNRALKILGGAFFGLVTGRLMRGAPALATHQGPPSPCFGFRRCHHCFGSSCTQYCHWHSTPGYTKGCPSRGQCWYGCSGSLLYQCCDWHEVFPGQSQHNCLCRSGSLGFC